VDYDHYRAWLEGQPPSAVVGYARDPLGDPLARFLSITYQRTVAVGYNAARIADRVAPLPDWARAYQRLIDARPPQTAISAREALALLDAARNRSTRASPGNAELPIY
jgi:hypothetical protein